MTNLCLNYIFGILKYSDCGPFTKHTERISQFMKDGRLSHIYKNELDKACFQHDMTYNKYKDLKGRTQSDIVFKNKGYKIAVNPRYDGFRRALASMVWKFFKRKKVLKGSSLNNEKLADELHKPIIKNFKRRKVYSSFKACIRYFYQIFIFSPNDSPSKTMKNAFYFI